jgi:hypothetical protein
MGDAGTTTPEQSGVGSFPHLSFIGRLITVHHALLGKMTLTRGGAIG